MEQNASSQVEEQPFMMLFVEKIELSTAQASHPTYLGVTGTSKDDYSDDK